MLNLSQLSQVQQAIRTAQKIESRKINTEEKKNLLTRIENSTQRQTEIILSQTLDLPAVVENKEKIHHNESVTLTITFTKEQIEILKQAQDLIAHSVPEQNWAEAITYLAKKEVRRRTNFNNSASKKLPQNNLTLNMKKKILKRDQSCQYHDKTTGKTCGSTRFLQVDHRQSAWAGGDNEIQNLQILCSQHNQHKYRRESFLK